MIDQQFEKPPFSCSFLYSNESDIDCTEHDVDLATPIINNQIAKKSKKDLSSLLPKDTSLSSTSSTLSYSTLISSTKYLNNKALNEFDANLKDKNLKILDKLINTTNNMKEELNAKDQLIRNIEQENAMLNSKINLDNEKFKTLNLINMENSQLLNEVKQLRKHVEQLKLENCTLKKSKMKSQDAHAHNNHGENTLSMNTLTEYLEFAGDHLKIDDYKREINELNQIIAKMSGEKAEFDEQMRQLREELKKLSGKKVKSGDLQAENEKLKKQISLLQKQELLETQINDTFQMILKQKIHFENENKMLQSSLEENMTKIKVLDEESLKKLKENHQMAEKVKKLSTELNDLKDKFTKIQQDLNSKQNEVTKLNQERSSLLKALNTIQEEKQLYELTIGNTTQKQLNQFESQNGKLKAENESLNQKIDALNKLTNDQQKTIKELLNDLDEKNLSIDKLSSKKNEELKRVKQTSQLTQDKLKYEQLKHQNEIDELKKKHTRELEGLKTSSESATARNGDLARSNSELRKKVQQAEESISELNEKIHTQKQQIDLLTKQKRDQREDSERCIQALKKDLTLLENMRDEYLRKNESQQKSIENLLDQISNFQKETDNLIKHNRNLNDKLKKSVANYDAYKQRYMELKHFVKQQQFETYTRQEIMNNIDSNESTSPLANDIYASASFHKSPIASLSNYDNLNEWFDLKIYSENV